MPDVFDTLPQKEETGMDISLSIMPKKRDIFDTIAPAGEKDIFDRIAGRSTEEIIAIEGGGLKAPGEYTGSWWKDILPSLADPGVWMDPANIGAALGIKPAQKALGAIGEAVWPKSARIAGQAAKEVPLPTPTPPAPETEALQMGMEPATTESVFERRALDKMTPPTPPVPAPKTPPAAQPSLFDAPVPTTSVQTPTPTPPVPTMSPQIPTKPPPAVREVPTDSLSLDPERFQYKVLHGETGTTGSLSGVQKYDPNLAGVVQTWTDPADGKTYVINGHNRVALAKAKGAPSIAVRELQVGTAEEARAVGALTNIAEGRGTAADAAKLFRDNGITKADLEARGIPMKEKIATDGLALSNLDAGLFQEVIQGTLPQERGVIIGGRLTDHTQQRALLDLLKKHGRVGNDTVRELADFVKDAPSQQVAQDTLFGAEEKTVSLAMDKARLAATIRERLATDKALFGRVGQSSAAQRLGQEGSTIDVARAQQVSQQSAQLLEQFDKLKNASGPVSDLLNQGAQDLAQGKDLRGTSTRVYAQLSPTIKALIPGAEGGRTPGGAAGIGTQQSPAAAQVPLRGSLGQSFLGGNPLAPLQGTIDRAKSVASSVKAALAPASVSEQSGWMARRFREMGGALHMRTVQAQAEMKQALKHFDKMPRQKALDFMHAIETGARQPTPELQGMADAIDAMFQDRVTQVQKLGTGALEHVRDNYFPHIWERLTQNSPNAAQQMAALYGKKPLAGPAHFVKKRLIDTIAEGLRLTDANGLPVLKLVSENPAELALMHVREMDRYILGQRLFAEMKDAGLAKFGSGFSKPKGAESWMELNDKIARKSFKLPAGAWVEPADPKQTPFKAPQLPIMAGKYYAPEDVARIFNNYLGPGLRGNPFYDAVQGANNKLNSIQLGMSAFHLTAEAINAAVSEVGLGLSELLQPGAGGQSFRLKGLARAARGAVSGPIETFLTGNKTLKGMMQPGAAGGPLAAEIDHLIKAGGRTSMDAIYRTGAAQGFWRSLRQAPIGTIIEKASWPIMGYAVPRLKLGAFTRLAESELARAGVSASDEAGRKILSQAWDSIDNRFGQLVYDNLFWNKMLKDIAHLSTRSVGWNLGTIREIGGAVSIDLPKQLIKLAGGQGKQIRITPREAYTIALPAVTAMYGGITMYLMTGRGPETLKDYFYPRTGLIRKDGFEDRVSLPSYMKDVYAYGKDPLSTLRHKISPLAESTIEMLRNEDFYGATIRDPDDPLLKQAYDVMRFGFGEMRPFALQGAMKEYESGGDLSSAARSFLGVTPAPASITRPAEVQQRIERRQMRRGLAKKRRQAQEYP